MTAACRTGKAGAVNGKASPSLEALAQQEALKEAGNAAFKAGNYREAIEKYTLAIKADPSNGVIYSNRAQALIKVGPPLSCFLRERDN